MLYYYLRIVSKNSAQFVFVRVCVGAPHESFFPLVPFDGLYALYIIYCIDVKSFEETMHCII